MLLTKIIKIKWSKKNKKWYESKGYLFTKIGDEFEVKIEDLSKGADITVNVKCDNPECKTPYLTPVQWGTYKRHVHEDGKYYCRACANKLYVCKNSMLTRLKNGKSFEQWCIENNRQDILDRWDYDLNNCKPNEVNYSTNKKFYYKCSKGIHKSELKNINRIIFDNLLIKCSQCNSFAQWCLDNNRQDILNRWDYKLNKYKPNEIGYGSNKRVYLKCPKWLHKSELKNINAFTSGSEGSIDCKACNSFAQWGIDNLGEDFLEKYWDKGNKINPWKISKRSGYSKILTICQEDQSHKNYYITPNDFNRGVRCPECRTSKGEKRCKKVFISKNFIEILQDEYNKLLDKNNNTYFIPQKTFDRLIGLGGCLLSYDFYIPKYNLLIEYQGEYHDKPIKLYKKEPMKYAKERLLKQQEHDRRKKEYALKNGYNFLEIWYCDFDNIEEILDKELIGDIQL